MEEKSNIEILRDFAKRLNRPIYVKELQYPLTGIRTFPKYKRMVYVPYDSNNTSFFIWYSDTYDKVGYPTIYCGSFIPISLRIKSQINIRSKNILDKFNFFSKSNKNTIDNDYFDSRVIISGNVDVATKRLLSQSKIQDQLLVGLEIDNYINISINEHNVDFVPELKNMSYLSIINPQSWCLERDEIETIFRQIEKIRKIIL